MPKILTSIRNMLTAVWNAINPIYAESFREFISESEKIHPRTIEIKLKKVNMGYTSTDSFRTEGPLSYQYYFSVKTSSPEKSTKDILFMECIGKPVLFIDGDRKIFEDAEKFANESIKELAEDIRKFFPTDEITFVPPIDPFVDTTEEDKNIPPL